MISEVVDRICQEFNIQDKDRVFKIITGKSSDEPAVKLEEIAQEVISKHGMTMEQLHTKSDKSHYKLRQSGRSEYVDARVDFSKKARFLHGYSTARIGKFLGVDHTTIVHYTNNRKEPFPFIDRKIIRMNAGDKVVELPRVAAEYTNIKSGYL